MARLLSGRVKKTAPEDLKEDRYQFLRLADAQPDLGKPAVDNPDPRLPDGDSVLVRKADGTPPEWTYQPSGLDISGQTNKLTHRISDVANYEPTPEDLAFGEIMINTRDAVLFYKRKTENNTEEIYSLPEIGGNIDGGRPDSLYGGNITVDGGGVTR